MVKNTLKTLLAATILTVPVLSFQAQNVQAQNAQAQEHAPVTFTLINKTSRPLEAFYAAPPQLDNWEEDILGGKALMPGESVLVKINDGRPDCQYDFKGVLGPTSDGSVGRGELIQTAVQVCEGGTYEYKEN